MVRLDRWGNTKWKEQWKADADRCIYLYGKVLTALR